MRLIGEWMTRAHPGATVVMRARVGGPDPELKAEGLTDAELRALGVFRRWADAIVLEPGLVHIYEAKIRLSPGALEQLRLYDRLFPLTPEYEAYKDLPRELHLVYAIEDPAIVALAREYGIKAHLFRPAWIDEYLNQLSPRHTRPPQVRGLQIDLTLPEEETP